MVALIPLPLTSPQNGHDGIVDIDRDRLRPGCFGAAQTNLIYDITGYKRRRYSDEYAGALFLSGSLFEPKGGRFGIVLFV